MFAQRAFDMPTLILKVKIINDNQIGGSFEVCNAFVKFAMESWNVKYSLLNR